MEYWDEGCRIKSGDMLSRSIPAASSGSTSSSSGSASASPSSASSLLDFPSVQLRKDAPSSLKLELENIELSLAATTSRESLLDELLGDIRRSCGTSLASTPTLVSQSEGEGENVFECKLRRSETELRTLSISELNRIADTLKKEADCVSSLLVRLLHVKDKRTWRANKQAERLSAILRDYACQNDLCTDLSFSLYPPPSPGNHEPWLNAWRVLSRLPRGIPKTWRKALWSGITSVTALDWPSIFQTVFSEYAMPGDEALGMQIVKDLHRTGDTGFTTEEEHTILKRVLLAYARFNKSTGYCQGFNILAALILRVVEFDEHIALKVMVHLVDYVLPENYFAQNLYALSVDMATFRELLKHVLPELSQHIDGLQKEASGTIKKAYSSECPPDIQSIHAYEPPLADVFSMQWFLTIFASALPRKATRRVWDLIFLEGSEMLLYTGVAIMAVMEKDLLQTSTAADFYSTMALLGERLRKAQLLPSAEFIQVIHTVQECIAVPGSAIPPIKTFREKYAYNVCPCATPEDDDSAELLGNTRQCPVPSRGGAFSLSPADGGEISGTVSEEKTKQFKKKGGLKEVEYINGQRNPSLPEGELKSNPVKAQIKLLREHYNLTAKRPATVRCSIDLAPPRASIMCPQTKCGFVQSQASGSVLQSAVTATAYGPDVPDHVIEMSKILSGQDTLHALTQQRRKVFTIDYSQEFLGDDPKYKGMEVGGLEGTKWKDFNIATAAGLLSNSAGARGRSYMTAREHLLRSGNRHPS